MWIPVGQSQDLDPPSEMRTACGCINHIAFTVQFEFRFEHW
jgi:hypothetical protein